VSTIWSTILGYHQTPGVPSKKMQKRERRLANPVALPGLSTAIRLTWSKCRRAARALPENAALRFPQNPGCFAEIASAVGPHVRVNPQILSESPAIQALAT